MSIAPGFLATCLAEIPEGPLSADLYFPMGPKGARKLVRVHPAGTELGQARRAQMLSRGIRMLWIKSEQEAQWTQAVHAHRPRSSAVAHCLIDAILDDAHAQLEKSAWEEAMVKGALEIVCRAIQRPGVALSPAWLELSSIALSRELTSHSVRVAAYTALFAMAFEHEDPKLLSELMTAGFLHDLGMLELGIPLAATPSQLVPAESKESWETHTHASTRAIEKYAQAALTENLRLWIEQHHERFGGGGYPLGLEGYKVNDLSQLLAAADLLDELASGRWDEKRRGLRGALEALEDFDREKTFPQYFNPDLLKAMLGWSKRTKFAAKSAAA